MSRLMEISRKIDSHIAAIDASSDRKTILWHHSRCIGKIRSLSFELNMGMGYRNAQLVKDACDVERNRLSVAYRAAIDRNYARIGGGK